MTKSKITFNKKKFFKFMFVVTSFVVSIVAGNGDVTGALVLAMLI